MILGVAVIHRKSPVEFKLLIVNFAELESLSTEREMLKECSKMYHFQHPHVVTLTGVCLDGGPASYIIMPFMANGSLLAYLKRNRFSLFVS